MKKRKVLCVFGTRPEAIKMGPVINRLREERKRLQVKVCVTAQHRGMLDKVLNLFNISPHYDLNLMREGQSLEHITRQVIERFSPVLDKERPDLVLIHGDTSSSLLAAMSSFYKKVPVGHVEAGLRSYDLNNPFPEEANRRLSDALCTLHFAPTRNAKINLLKENIAQGGIFVTGNTVIDALRWAVRTPKPFGEKRLKTFFKAGMNDRSSKIILVTAHRRENFGRPLKNICSALWEIAEKNKNVRIIYPVHPNPNVRSVVYKTLKNHPRILLLPPLDYLDFSALIKRSSIVVTDSGGLQEEAPSLGKPVLVLRKVTERPEAVKAFSAKVIGTDKSRIIREVSKLLNNAGHYRKMASAVNPYGDGRASRRIVEAILYFFNFKKIKPQSFSP